MGSRVVSMCVATAWSIEAYAYTNNRAYGLRHPLFELWLLVAPTGVKRKAVTRHDDQPWLTSDADRLLVAGTDQYIGMPWYA